MLLTHSAQRLAFGLDELPRRPSGLQCRLCDWAPPPLWREQVQPGKHHIDWYAIYDEHMRFMHRPHAIGCLCVECV